MQTFETVTILANRLSTAEKAKLVEYLSRTMNNPSTDKKAPQSFRGIWKEKFPDNFDAEKEIREIRDDWKEKFEDL